MPIAGKDANLRIASGVATTSTGEAATRSTGVAGTGYVQVNSTVHRYIDPTSTATLYVEALGSTTLVASTLYAVNGVQGLFQWVSGDPSTGIYTADIEWLTASQVSGGREWTLSVEADMFETSEFGSSGWKTYQPNLGGASATIGKYWTDETFFDLFNTEEKFIVELVIDGTDDHRYEGFVRISGDQITTPTDGLVGENINLVFDGAVYYSTG